MPEDGFSRDVQTQAMNIDEDENVRMAKARLAQEANAALSYGRRGVSNITEQFNAASKELYSGQLVKDEYFTLFEAVGALEIMDPKMDSGVIPPGEPLDPTFNPAAPLDTQQVLWIIDQLSSLEIAWHQGYPLSQTVFTSLHVDRLLAPENRYPYTFSYGQTVDLRSPGARLTHTVLRAYCVAVIKSCQVVLQLVQSQNFYEEEDFVTHLFGQDLLPRLTEEEAKLLLDDALDWLATSKVPEDLKSALNVRLESRRAYMLSVFGVTNEWETLVSSVKGNLESGHALGKPVDDAFTDKVQRHLATSTPPRPMLETTWEDAQSKWQKLFSDVAEAARLTSFRTRQSPNCLQRATWSFASRSPNTYARAILQDLLFAEGRVAGDIPHYDLFLTDIRDLVLAGDPLSDPESFQVEVPSDPRHRCSRIFEGFMDKAFDEYLNFYRMVCQNRCRIRRTFTQAIPLLDELETSLAAETDRQINAIVSRKKLDSPVAKKVSLNPLKTWTRYYKLKIMAETISLGFETDIYLDFEMGQMYWYLSTITKHRRRLIDHIEIFLKDRMAQMLKSPNTQYMAQTISTQDWLHSLRAEADCTIALANALATFHNLIMHLGLIKPAARPFATAQLVYEARMKPYLAVTDPSPPDAIAFAKSQQLDEKPTDALASINNEVKAAKTQLAALTKTTPQAGKYVGTEDRWKAEIKQLMATCVAVSVGSTLLRRTLDIAGESEVGGLGSKMEVSIPEPGKRYHDWWIVPQLREKA